jgi:hypothetical protein
MAIYVVERYLPSAHLESLAAAVERTTRLAVEGARTGGPRYLSSTFLAEEETCLCRFEAPDRDAVAELNRRADFPFDRIVEAVDLLPTHGITEGA